jgi:hypothetical protein
MFYPKLKIMRGVGTSTYRFCITRFLVLKSDRDCRGQLSALRSVSEITRRLGRYLDVELPEFESDTLLTEVAKRFLHRNICRYQSDRGVAVFASQAWR